ncbi:uncharacterized protein EV422DRAFT_199543 [Fimicolochytrium jonesii]|uniref:uncharacterized protein n=1 Tax=Fimicolochytrium jonesii TaxID=1396493 RepID=UPI0022FE8F18|nr:uncharacterized protein EV422DRAFT_199543 [Fimicolochytrium jonesii]KAI8817948.1 hypothetical protein EV422DRAFT_199543 [Fimicolochytrium jonesii]
MTTDYLTYLEDYIGAIENVPADIQHTLYELRSKDEECDALRRSIRVKQSDLSTRMEAIVRTQVQLASSVNGSSSMQPRSYTDRFSFESLAEVERKQLVDDYPDQKELVDKIRAEYDRCVRISEEKMAIAARSKELIDRYLTRLSEDLDRADSPASNTGSGRSSVIGSTSSLGATADMRPQMTPSFSREQTGSGTVALLMRSAPGAAVFSTTSSIKTRPGRRPAALNKRITKRKTFSLSNDCPSLSPRLRGASPDVSDDQVYCYCQQGSFGEMIACDNHDCEHEWYHLECVGLSAPPAGGWMCPTCSLAYEKSSSNPRAEGLASPPKKKTRVI